MRHLCRQLGILTASVWVSALGCASAARLARSAWRDDYYVSPEYKTIAPASCQVHPTTDEQKRSWRSVCSDSALAVRQRQLDLGQFQRPSYSRPQLTAPQQAQYNALGADGASFFQITLLPMRQPGFGSLFLGHSLTLEDQPEGITAIFRFYSQFYEGVPLLRTCDAMETIANFLERRMSRRAASLSWIHGYSAVIVWQGPAGPTDLQVASVRDDGGINCRQP